MTQNCSYCGRENQDISVFCRECGSSLTATPSSISLVVPHRTLREILKSTWQHFAIKRVIFLIGGICWFLFALGFSAIIFLYIHQGAGLQFFGPPVSSESVALGLIHVIGLVVIVVLCFSVGAGLCAHGIVREED